MKCPKCESKMKFVEVNIEGAKNKVLSYQCSKCDYFEFDTQTGSKVLEELREQPLKIKQKIVKLSNNRLGIYFNKHLVESLNLKPGEQISITVPDKKHFLVHLE